MLLGHFAVGLAAKRVAPRAGVLALVGAAMFLDLVWPLLLLAGLESVQIVPHLTEVNDFDFTFTWSHSLVTALVWSALFASLYRARTADLIATVVTGALVFSHWVLDWITHIPDMPLWPNGPKVGLGLWKSAAATVGAEAPMFVAGVAIYLATTRARSFWGHVSLWSFVLFAVFIYATTVGAPSPDPEAIKSAALSIYLLLPWFFWIDKTRELRGS